MSDSRGRRSLPLASADAVLVVGSLGVLTCVLCCVSIPGIVAAISALGLGFLRNDRLLSPAVAASLVLLLAALVYSRTRHGRTVPLVLGLAAAIWTFIGLRSPAPLGTIAALTGAPLLVVVILWDWRLQRRCST